MIRSISQAAPFLHIQVPSAGGGLSLSEKPFRAFPTKGLQSAARTRCTLFAYTSHTCSLKSIFCQVHAPAENDSILFAASGRQTLRGLFDTLRPPPVGGGLIFALFQICIGSGRILTANRRLRTPAWGCASAGGRPHPWRPHPRRARGRRPL